MATKRVYTFGNGKAEGNAQMREALGGKGANLAEMNLIGVPVPPGFTITTEVCTEYNTLGREAVVKILEEDVDGVRVRNRNKELLDVETQVDILNEMASDPNLLGRMWIGWSPFI